MNVRQKGRVITEWLKADEARSREGRARRLRHLLKVIPAAGGGVFFCGGDLARKLFDEIRRSYINGLDLATVLLALSYIEYELSARLYGSGWEQAKAARLGTVLLKAKECHLISDTEFATFQYLRGVRNAYAHFRPLSHPTSMLSRSVNEDELSDDIVARDAEQAIEALGSFFARQDGMF